MSDRYVWADRFAPDDIRGPIVQAEDIERLYEIVRKACEEEGAHQTKAVRIAERVLRAL